MKRCLESGYGGLGRKLTIYGVRLYQPSMVSLEGVVVQEVLEGLWTVVC